MPVANEFQERLHDRLAAAPRAPQPAVGAEFVRPLRQHLEHELTFGVP